MGGPETEYCFSIALDADANVFSAGEFLGTVDFDPGLGIFNMVSPPSLFNTFISKLDSSGNFVWAKKLGGPNVATGNSIFLDANANIYSTGPFQGTADFDPGAATYNLVSSGSTDVFISKLDSSGNFLWAKQFGGTSSDVSRSVGLDAAGNIYIAGNFVNTVDFDPGIGTYNLTSVNGSADAYVSALDPSGNFLWASQISGIDAEDCFAMAIDASANVYITGRFSGTPDFDPGIGTYNLTSFGSVDIYVVKLGVITGIAEQNNSFNSINISPNPATNQFTIHNSQSPQSKSTMYLEKKFSAKSQQPATSSKLPLTFQVGIKEFILLK